ncbi:MAG: 4-phosphoerythronate dehydrogenase [Melioribacteraceae bacterium]|nr:4-phosphoerythronate dehydrogenase [Melioribacteraceae bacterium]
MNIIVDENINFGKEAFSTLGDVTLVPGRKLTDEMIKSGDALIVRSITKVNKELLKGSNIKFVGTATIGTDHIDKNYLAENNIAFADAAGCNSQSVTEYVLASISHIYNKNGLSLSGKSIGIIGVGNIGSKVARLFTSLGLKVVKNDPPLQRKSGRNEYSSIEESLACDIITCHVPLNFSGEDKTYHLIDEARLSQLKPGTLLINSSRGPVVDNNALINRLQKKKDIFTVLDVWETEPNINTDLMKMTDLASAHIAGYSYEGKVNGTTIIYNKLCQFLGVEPVYKVPENPVGDNIIKLTGNETFEEKIEKIITKSYNITVDDKNLRNTPERFDQLRKEYRIRRELSNYIIKQADKEITISEII